MDINHNYNDALRDFWAEVYSSKKEIGFKMAKNKLKFLKEDAGRIADKVLENRTHLTDKEKSDIKNKLVNINFSQFLEKKKKKNEPERISD